MNKTYLFQTKAVDPRRRKVYEIEAVSRQHACYIARHRYGILEYLGVK